MTLWTLLIISHFVLLVAILLGYLIFSSGHKDFRRSQALDPDRLASGLAGLREGMRAVSYPSYPTRLNAPESAASMCKINEKVLLVLRSQFENSPCRSLVDSILNINAYLTTEEAVDGDAADYSAMVMLAETVTSAMQRVVISRIRRGLS